MLVPEEYSSERERRLDEAIAEYYLLAEAGEVVAPSVFVARHPDLTDDLVSFFADKVAFERRLGAPAPTAERVTPPPPPPVASPADDTRLQADDTAVGGRQGKSETNTFGDYELIEELARGNTGVVWRARQISQDRMVALKQISPNCFRSADDAARFRAAVKAAGALDHPHILPIYDVGEIRGQHYVVTKLIFGRSLATCVSELVDGRRRAVDLLVQVARAVHHAHQRGVPHRNLEPANVLLDAVGTPYVADFGVAGGLAAEPILGPAQSRADESKAGDVHALGAILYECLTGMPPFKAAAAPDAVREGSEKPPAAPQSLPPDLPRDLEMIALKCLETQPERRYSSAAAFADDLERWLRGEPIGNRPTGVWHHGAKGRRLAVAAGLVLLAVVGVVAMFGRWRQPEGVQYGADRETSQREQPPTETLTRRAREHLDQGRFDKAVADYSLVIEKEPKNRDAWIGRGEAHAELGKWKEADLDFARAIDLDPGHAGDWDNRLLVLLAAGRLDEYRATLARMLARFGPRSDRAMACVRIPAAVDVVTLLRVVFATPADKMDSRAEEPIQQQFTLGTGLCRAGLHEAALRELLAVEKRRPQPAVMDVLFLALSIHGLGENAEALLALRLAEQMIEEAEGKKTTWQQRVVWQALRQEAAKLLE